MIVTIIFIINLLLASTNSFTVLQKLYVFSSNVADVIIQTQDLKHLKLQKSSKLNKILKNYNCIFILATRWKQYSGNTDPFGVLSLIPNPFTDLSFYPS